MPERNPLRGWQVDRGAIRHVGHDLQRPECVLAEPDGTLWAADARGGVMRIDADGRQTLVVPRVEAGVAADSRGRGRPLAGDATAAANDATGAGGADGAGADGAAGDAAFDRRYVQAEGSLPNGLAFDAAGNFLIANWGTDAIESMTRDGLLRTLHREIGGRPLGKANFVLRDARGRVWITVTTREQPWTRQLQTKATDGYLALMDEGGLRVVAEGFCGTNEVRFDAREEWLYVVESTGRRISRLRIGADGAVREREVFGPDPLPGFPDGFAFDAFGNLWITLIFTDQLVALTPEGDLLTLLDDSDPVTRCTLLERFEAGTLTPDVMAATAGTVAPWMASLTFGGPDLRTVYLGSLRGTTLPSFRAPVAGLPLAHWRSTA